MSFKDEVYLDHAGAPRPTSSLLRKAIEDLEKLGLGNPHSGGISEPIIARHVVWF